MRSGRGGDQALGRARLREVRGQRLDRERRARGGLRRDDVVQRQRVDGAAAEAAVARQAFGELAADHAAAAEDENVHRG